MQGFKTLERTNVVVNANDKFSVGRPHAAGRRDDRGDQRHRARQRAADDERRALVHAGERDPQEHRRTTGACCSTSRTLVPGACPRTPPGTENAQVSAFTVNGQRPNSNNMTIDGVTNIDTGDNGGNMATTNIDAVAEFKILTNAYQAEYGRAVGGQVQVVTKSGTQAFHGSGYWYGRRSDWNANTWTNKRAAAPRRRSEPARRSRSRSPRATTTATRFGGPIFIPGVFNTDKKKLFFFWSQEYQRRTQPRRPSTRPACPPPSSGPATSRRASTTAATRSPTSATTRPACPAAPPNTSGCFQDGGVLGRIPAEPPLRARASTPSTSSRARTSPRAAASTSHSQDSDTGAAPRGPAPARLPGHRQVALHRPLHEHEGRYRPGLRHDLGGQRQRPAARRPRSSCIPGSNYMLSTTGILNPTTSLEMSVGRAHNSLELRACRTRTVTARRPASPACRCSSRTPSRPTTSPGFSSAAAARATPGQYQTDRGPFTNENTT